MLQHIGNHINWVTITAKAIFPQTMRMSFLIFMMILIIALSYSVLTQSSEKKPLLNNRNILLGLVLLSVVFIVMEVEHRQLDKYTELLEKKKKLLQRKKKTTRR